MCLVCGSWLSVCHPQHTSLLEKYCDNNLTACIREIECPFAIESFIRCTFLLLWRAYITILRKITQERIEKMRIAFKERFQCLPLFPFLISLVGGRWSMKEETLIFIHLMRYKLKDDIVFHHSHVLRHNCQLIIIGS